MLKGEARKYTAQISEKPHIGGIAVAVCVSGQQLHYVK